MLFVIPSYLLSRQLTHTIACFRCPDSSFFPVDHRTSAGCQALRHGHERSHQQCHIPGLGAGNSSSRRVPELQLAGGACPPHAQCHAELSSCPDFPPPLCMAKHETGAVCRLKSTTSLSAWLAKLWSHWAAASMRTPMERASSGWSIAVSACDQR